MNKISISCVNIADEERTAVDTVLRSGHIVQGEEVGNLERDLAQYCQVNHAIAVNSGTAALHTALFAAGIGAGDEVITSPFTFVATANAILMTGATPIFADIDENYFHLTADSITQAITPRTKAVLVVDLYGQPVDYDSIKKVCAEHNILLISDACQAIGAEYHGIRLGGIADITTLSLYASKNLMSGEGGVVLTNNTACADRAKLFRNHGQDSQYHYQFLGYNYRLTDILATIARARLPKLESQTETRIANATYLSQGLRDITGLHVPALRKNVRHVFHQYTVRITSEYPLSREQLINKLSDAGIEGRVYYPVLLNHVPHLKHSQSCTIAEQVQNQVLSLPVHPFLSPDDLNAIISVIKNTT